ncbi:MAG: AAA family ATPase [Candidatus Omnitrophica bacterium]|nr:AAA family ATPase [Candidatus Omnitrophota bacterium]
MYEQFFALKQKPFSLTSNPSFLFLSRRHKEALSSLLYGIKERVGFIEITGEIGAGKTTLCRALLNQLDEKTKTAFIFNSNLSGLQLMQTIVEDLGIEARQKNKGSLFSELNRFLIQQLGLGNNVVLIIDEAQNLSAKILEQIRMLSNLESGNEKLLQIILVGQPELRQKLELPHLRQLRQRIAIRYHIKALDKEEVPLYITHRLNQAGSNGAGPFFDADAYEEIFKYSAGIPRLINNVCDKSLLMAFVLETRSINAEIVKKSIVEIEGGVSL